MLAEIWVSFLFVFFFLMPRCAINALILIHVLENLVQSIKICPYGGVCSLLTAISITSRDGVLY